MSDQAAAPVINSNAISELNGNKPTHCETCESCVAAQKLALPPKTVESESQTDNEVSDLQANTSAARQAVEPQTPKKMIETKLDAIECEANEMDVFSEYLLEPEQSLIEIKEKITDHGLDKLPLADSESEEDDQLKPLMIDNHTTIDHKEYFNFNATPFFPPQFIKPSAEAKDSYSSTDSETSGTCDRRVPSSQQAGNSSDATYFDDITKDSGCCVSSSADIKEIDCLTPAEIPDDRMCEEIVEQVEYYFSNDSILKDAFLLKHVRRNKEGYVSLKLVSSFKRVRQLTKDWRVVGYAIREKSRKIELNDLGTKIRRLEPLPSFDETMPSRTIVATDLPVNKLSIEKVTEIFSKCGEIALVRILKPGMGIPVDVRQFMNKYPEMQQKECALVEFVESHSARNARNISGNFQVLEMVAPKKKTGKKAQTVTKIIESYKFPESNYERSRGGVVGSPMESDYKYKMRRSSEYYVKPEQHQQLLYQPQRSHSCVTEPNAFGLYSPRRVSNCSASSNDFSRKYSSCSEGYSSCSDMSRRASGCSTDQSRRTSNCSDMCPCSRRMSGCSDIYRRMSQCSDHRRYSSGVLPFERSFSNPQDMRRPSMDSNYERKISAGSMGGGIPIHDSYRKFSNGFDPNRKLSNPDQYYHGRRISTDSGFDRKQSFSSDYGTSPRSRSNSFLMCQHKTVENVVRTPIGPDGSKGFASRTRKLGQIVPPVN